MLELALSSRSLLRLAIGRLSGNSLSAANAAEAIYKEGRTPGYIAASDKNIDALFSRENSFQADSIQVPIRLVVGGQDPLASLLSHDTLITLATDVSVTVLPRCGHMIELQAPAQVSSLIERFIDELT
jgi:pimeloyl-ACP methyl ester carboxylesterase